MTLVKKILFAAAMFAGLFLTGCGSSHFEAPELQGDPAMVADGDQPRLWVLSKQEEQRMRSVGGRGRGWRTDTYFHFDLQAFDPVTARPLWKQRLMTLGDPDAKNTYQLQTRVMGSSVGARLLGQDGDLVWLLIGESPFAVKASDGSFVVDPDTLQAANPELKGLLPSEEKHYGFDRGLVVMAADARQWVVRGAGHKVENYVPTPQPPAYPEPRLKSNGSYDSVPIYPIGEIPVRQVELDGQWLGLYSEKEAAEAGNDNWGGKLRYPYQVLDEGALARRTFWRAKIVTTEGDDPVERLSELTPVAGSSTWLRGRFLKDPATGLPGEALLLDDPPGVLVLHSTRMDDAGRLALARVDTNLGERWKTELPLSETSTINQVQSWRLPGTVVIVGELHDETGGVTSWFPHLVSVDLADGRMQAWNLHAEAPVESAAP